MRLLHLAIDASAPKICDYLLALKGVDVTVSTTGPLIRGKVAATPPLHLAVLAAARHGCNREHASWSILEKFVNDVRWVRP